MDKEDIKNYSRNLDEKSDENINSDQEKLFDSDEELEEEIKEKDQEIKFDDSCNEKMLYLAAELQNTRNRLLKDIESARFNAIRSFALDMCEVADNMFRARQYIKPGSNDSVAQGIEMILNSLSGIFKRHGIDHIDALNKKFDPSLHDAISEEESLDLSPGYVVREIQAGYTLDGKLLRPAKVIVSKGKVSPSRDFN